jgi:putative ABC transport system ATP-binding protein
MVAVEVEKLTVEFNSSGYKVRPLTDLSFRVDDGELAVLLGPSGCGKTTLLSCLAGLLTPTRGSIRLDGEEITELRGAALSSYRRDRVGVVFQAFNLIPSLSATANVMVPLRFSGTSGRDAKARAAALLDQVGLGDRGGHRPDQLSGGQQQRVAIARALVHDPPLILADEPTAHLDFVQVEGVLRLIRGLAGPGRAVIVATHDDRITQLADRVVELVPIRDHKESKPVAVRLTDGECLFRQGDPSDLVYVVNSGEMELFRELADGGEEPIAILAEGGYFGELGPMLNLPRSATARAVGGCTLTAYSVQMFRSLSTKDRGSGEIVLPPDKPKPRQRRPRAATR